MKTLIVSGNGQTKQGTMSPIELLWTAKNGIMWEFSHSIVFSAESNSGSQLMTDKSRQKFPNGVSGGVRVGGVSQNSHIIPYFSNASTDDVLSWITAPWY